MGLPESGVQGNGFRPCSGQGSSPSWTWYSIHTAWEITGAHDFLSRIDNSISTSWMTKELYKNYSAAATTFNFNHPW
jgi:hypothetical protein